MILTEIDIFNILLLVALALIFARVLGYLFNRIKQPAVLGEIIAGILLGGIVILVFSGQQWNLFGYTLPIPDLSFISVESNPLHILAEIGILFLLFISGLEISVSKLKKMGKPSTLVAVGGVILPLVLGIIAGVALGFDFKEGIIIGLILTATSVGVTVRTLMDLQVLDTDVGATVLGAAVIDDVLAIILLAFAMGIEKSLYDVAWVGIKIVIFFLIFLLLGLKVIDKILELGEKINLPKAFLSISLAILLIYSFFADKAGISGIIGAFVAGILIGQNFRSKKIEEDVKTIGYGFFIPLFFVWVGLMLWEGTGISDFSLVDTIIITFVIIIVSIIGKIIGSGIGAKIAGMTNKESLQIGVGMIPRMELALIIATAAVSRGLFLTEKTAHQILITTVLLTIITTLIAPVLIKASFKKG